MFITLVINEVKGHMI